jgi:hypothetical protein
MSVFVDTLGAVDTLVPTPWEAYGAGMEIRSDSTCAHPWRSSATDSAGWHHCYPGSGTWTMTGTDSVTVVANGLFSSVTGDKKTVPRRPGDPRWLDVQWDVPPLTPFGQPFAVARSTSVYRPPAD